MFVVVNILFYITVEVVNYIVLTLNIQKQI